MFITAAVCSKIFGGLLGTDTAFRLAVVIFQALTLVFVGVGARELVGPGKGWYGPALFMGCLGFVQLSHMLICDVSLVTGFAIAFAGLAMSGRRGVMGGILLGNGFGDCVHVQGADWAGIDWVDGDAAALVRPTLENGALRDGARRGGGGVTAVGVHLADCGVRAVAGIVQAMVSGQQLRAIRRLGGGASSK